MRPLNLGVSALVACAVAGCSGSEPLPTDNFDRNALLADFAERILLPTLTEFRARAAALKETTAALDLATQTSSISGTERAAAQEAFRAAMHVWQELEMYQVGPAGPASLFTGGQTLRDEIYSWPSADACRVDQETVTQDYQNNDFTALELTNVYGLDALDYLLFVETSSNTCGAPVNINREGTWTLLGPEGVRQNRATYADRLAEFIERDAARLETAWNDRFLQTWKTAGQEGSDFTTAQSAVDELFAAMFYLDLDLKDDKLGVPLGLDPKCSDDVCPEALESRYGHLAAQNIEGNLRAFNYMLSGSRDAATDATGFRDFLMALDAAAVSDELDALMAAAVASVDSLPAPLDEALVTDRPAALAVHTNVKAVADLLKTQFVSVLNIRLPDEGAADND